MSSPSAEDAGDVRKHDSFVPRPPTPPSSDRDLDHSSPKSPIASATTDTPSLTTAHLPAGVHSTETQAIVSPDAADQLLVQQIQSAEKTTFSVTRHRFERLAPHLSELRVDYDPKQEKLLRRMPTQVHESVVEVLRRRLYKEKDRLATSQEVDPRVRRALESTALRGSTTVTIGRGSRVEKRSPDISISERHNDVFPTFICEVAYSQATENVKELCARYIERTQGAVQCTLAVDLPYNRPGPGSVTVYRLGDKEINGEVWGGAVEAQTATIIHPDGEAEDAAIELQASDFLRLDPDEGGTEAESATIRIPLAEICHAYRNAVEGNSRPSKRKRHDAEQKRWPQVASDSEYEQEEEPQAKRQQHSDPVEDPDAAETAAEPTMSLIDRSTRTGTPSTRPARTPIVRRASARLSKGQSGG